MSSDDVIRTFEHGPSDPVRFTDGPGTYVEVEVAATPAEVWSVVTDLEAPIEFSDELLGAEWNPGDDGEIRPGVGAVFTGHNTHPAIGTWSTLNFVTEFEPERAFAWSVVDPDDPGARWRWDLSDAGDDRTTLRFSMTIGPGPSGTTMAIERMPDKEARIIHHRITALHENMTRTVDGLKRRIEQG